MRRENPGLDAGRLWGARTATVAGGGEWRPGVLEEGLLSASTELHRGVLTSGAADQLAALVARAAHAPVGLIHFAQGGRMRLYGGGGLARSWGEAADVPVEESLAALVMRMEAPVLVADLSADERIPPGQKGAYLGHPIRDQHGAVLGICCACDRRPRRWTADEVAAVAEAAQVCTLLITEQVARHEIDQQRRFLDAVLDSLHDGVTACDADGRIVFVNERMRAMWGEAGLPDDALAEVLPEGLTDANGRPLTRDDLGIFRALRGDHLRDEELILHGPDRRTRHYLVEAPPSTGRDGRTVGAVQAVQDVARRRRVERFRTCELAVTTAIAEAPSIEDAGPRVLEAVVSTLDWVHAELWLVDEAGAVVRSAARWSAPEWRDDIDVPVDLPFGTGL